LIDKDIAAGYSFKYARIAETREVDRLQNWSVCPLYQPSPIHPSPWRLNSKFGRSLFGCIAILIAVFVLQ
jgi:hypothetical protein